MNYFSNIWDEIVTWCHAGVDPTPPEPECAVCDKLIISENEVAGSWQTFNSDTQIYGQGFIIGDCSINSVWVPTGSIMGNPRFDFRMSIYNSAGGLPTTLIADSLNTFNWDEFTDNQDENIFLFDDVCLSAGNYCLVLSYENIILNDADNNIGIKLDATNPYASGGLSYKTGANPWALLNGWDFCCVINY